MTPENLATEVAPKPSEVNDVNTFFLLLQGWHSERVAVLEHMLEVPEGTTVAVNESEAKAIEGDFREGFIVGLTLALMELGRLPFFADFGQDDEELEPQAAA